MATEQLALNIPDGLLAVFKRSREELALEIMLMAAIKMFELGRLSSGKAAEMAGISRREFLEKCSMYGVSGFNYSEDEIAEEVSKDLKNAGEFGHSYNRQHRPA
jgi:predicted HTH domain antitoxin